MSEPKRSIKPLFSRGVKLCITLLTLTTISTQVLHITPAFADDGGYPWASAACIDGTDCSTTYNWGYGTCPSNDTGCYSYPYPSPPATATAGMADPWGMGVRNCTSYVAWKLNQVFNQNIISASWGSAYQWDTYATAHSYSNDSSPQVGDIAQWGSEVGHGFGHVAYVWKVSGSTAYFDDYNSGYPLDGSGHATWGNFDSTHSSVSNGSGQAPDHYIHIGTPTTANPGITPAAITVNGVLNVFKVGGDQQVYQNYWNSSINNWNGWTGLSGYTAYNPAVIINGGYINIFIRGNNGQIYTEYDGSGGWSGWTSLGTQQMLGDPYVMLYGTSMNVFALAQVGTNKVPYEDTQDSSGTWTGWGSNTNYMASDPVAVLYGGNLHLIYRGGDGKPYENVFGSNGWSGFSEIGQYASVIGNPTALSYGAEGELDVYFGTSNNQIWKDTNQGSGWGTWTEMASGSMTGDPYIMAYNNDLQVFSRDTSNNIWTRYWSYSGQSWSSWASLGGSSDSLASDPFAYQNGSSELDVYASDGNANTYDDTKIAPNNWGGFSELN